MEKDLDLLEDIKKKVEDDQKRIIRLQGKLDGVLESLSNEGMDGKIDATKRIKKLNGLKDKLLVKLEGLIEVFKEDYPELVGEE